MLHLKVKKLFHQQSYISGSWQDADRAESLDCHHCTNVTVRQFKSGT